jgi:hypothetical protein
VSRADRDEGARLLDKLLLALPRCMNCEVDAAVTEGRLCVQCFQTIERGQLSADERRLHHAIAAALTYLTTPVRES